MTLAGTPRVKTPIVVVLVLVVHRCPWPFLPQP
jgi:hypothetical protein